MPLGVLLPSHVASFPVRCNRSWSKSASSGIKVFSPGGFCRPLGLPACASAAPSAASPKLRQLSQDGAIRELFHDMDGFYAVSAYDMAWIAMVPNAVGSGPQFHQSIKWILDHQSGNGSWGQGGSLMNSTLACLVALKKWNQGNSSILKGLTFVKDNLMLLKENLSHDTAVILAKLLGEAQAVELELNYDEPYIQSLFAQRQHFLDRVSKERMLHEYPFSFVHILEAFNGTAWKNLLRYQSSDGLLFSVTLTACAYMETRNKLCLQCLTNAVNVNGSFSSDWSSLVKNVRLVFLLEHFGIKQHFEKEIQQTLSHAFGFWKGLEAAALSTEDAALIFRHLRGHGFEVSPDLFRSSVQDEKNLPWSTRFELYLASEYLFPGEVILKEPRSTHIKHNEYCDEETRFLLLFPWYSRMHRIEHIEYIKNYGTSEPGALVEFSKLEFNRCQLVYQKDLEHVMRWCKECEFSRLGYRQKELYCYFAPAATMFEPEFSSARIVWAKMGVLTTIIDDLFDHHCYLDELRDFYTAVRNWDPSLVEGTNEKMNLVFQALYNAVNTTSADAYALQGRDIGNHLRAQWNRLVHSMLREAEWRLTSHCPGLEEYMDNAVTSFALEPIIMSTIFFMGVPVEDSVIDHPDCRDMYRRVSLVGRLLNDIQGFKRESSGGEFSWITIYMKNHPAATSEDAVCEMRSMIDQAVQQLVEDLLRPRAVPQACKRVFESMLRVLNTFYRDGDGFSSEDLSHHVMNVLKTQL